MSNWYVKKTGVLCHHGVMGQKWGVRRYQNPDGSLTPEGRLRYTKTGGNIRTDFYKTGGVISKGSTLYRVDRDPYSPTYDAKKYVSTNLEDHDKWLDYIGKAYDRHGYSTYTIEYKTLKDISVASETDAGHVFINKCLKKIGGVGLDDALKEKAIADTIYAKRFLGIPVDPDKPISVEEMGSLNLAAQTGTGQAFKKALVDSGYGAVSDTHGKNVSEDPIIILNPDDKIKKYKVRKNIF